MGAQSKRSGRRTRYPLRYPSARVAGFLIFSWAWVWKTMVTTVGTRSIGERGRSPVTSWERYTIGSCTLNGASAAHLLLLLLLLLLILLLILLQRLALYCYTVGPQGLWWWLLFARRLKTRVDRGTKGHPVQNSITWRWGGDWVRGIGIVFFHRQC